MQGWQKPLEMLDGTLGGMHYDNCTCVICSKTFYRKPSEIASAKNHYCSQICYKARFNDSLPKPGQRFGMLTATGAHKIGPKRFRIFEVNCDCGSPTKWVPFHQVNDGYVVSCGCFRIKNFKEMAGRTSRTHGESGSRIYNIWVQIKQRCGNSNAPGYYLYGGRGITICPEWKESYGVFREWALNNGYSDDLTIDRIDNDGNYEPGNCRWATKIQQSNNRRVTCFVEYKGDMMPLAMASRQSGLHHCTIMQRIKMGWPSRFLFSKTKHVRLKKLLSMEAIKI